MPRRSDRAYIGFSCETEVKKKALILAKNSGNASLGSVCRAALKEYLKSRDPQFHLNHGGL